MKTLFKKLRRILTMVFAIIGFLMVLLAVLIWSVYSFRIQDDVNVPFVHDPQVLGLWKTVDFVSQPSLYTPGVQRWRGDLFLKEMEFGPRGDIFSGLFSGCATWTRGLVLFPGTHERTASKYDIRTIAGADYMFFEWKSGDYTYLHKSPSYYVLQRVQPRRDNMDHPFVDDPALRGEWELIGWQTGSLKLDLANLRQAGDSSFDGLAILPDGRTDRRNWTWTRGWLLNHKLKTASFYQIEEVDGQRYLLFECKADGYVWHGQSGRILVMKRVAPVAATVPAVEP